MKDLTSDTKIDPDFLIEAYANSFFPMADPRTRVISWYSPDPRAVIPLNAFRVSRSLDQVVRKGVFDMEVNAACREVIEACGQRDETWISEEIIGAYTILHGRGFVHSVESWRDGELVGGLYGVAIGGAFFGESMFSRVSNASKVALVHLVNILRVRGFRLLDTQFMNEHVRQFGAIEIPRSVYKSELATAVRQPTHF